ncbi:SusE domain-containing protein [Draconibacterium halophilum]|uniref:SusF/SusE family outer membrane protein n=1 Tax=Draconibacterium halophilum TaxID=2706887 RepID=A0A6C0R837_9BACT|nr:SusE domain-containing protein [Draconibacterium halophilum]QIA06370.1 SusF/SusE family outer membrane protein [Draconibacterium halophilum]
MKKINYILSILAVLLVFVSCEEETFDPVVGVYTPPTLEDVSGTYVFTEDMSDDVFKTFSWTDADFGFQSATTYTVQLDFAGNEFAEAVDLLNTSGLSASITVGELNQKLLAKGAKTNVPSDFEVRVTASVNDNVQTLASNAPVLNIHPFEVVISYPSLYLPGSYQAASGYGSDWSPDQAQQIYSVAQDEKYEGYVNMSGDDIQFKFTDEPNWDLNWGDTDADGTLDDGGDNIVIPEAGYYRINADINALTYSVMKTDWGLIGDATPDGWDADQNMTYSTETKTWSITLDLVAGTVKFRANDDWALDYGDTGFDGSLDQGGDNIPIDEAGNYTIVLNLEVAGYAYEIIKN